MRELVPVVVYMWEKPSGIVLYVGVSMINQQDPLNHKSIYTTIRLTISPGEYL